MPKVMLTDEPDGTETQPLLSTDVPSQAFIGTSASDGAALQRNYTDQARHGESYDNIPQEKRQLGFFSTVFLIFNRIIGTGIYATPSLILRASGSVGMSLVVWVLGALIAAVGTAVYIELGTGLPRNGGDKNYLEFMYRRPKFLVTCVYSTYSFLIASVLAANGLVFGDYSVHALALPPSAFTTRVLAISILAFGVFMHGYQMTWGLRLQNVLGFFKLIVLSAIALAGIFSLAGVPGFAVRPEYEPPKNFEWKHLWEGSGTGANALASAFYNVLSYSGFANANSSLSEIRDPVRTLSRAAPMAMSFVTFVYLFVNVAYFGVVSKADILESERIVAALFFRNLFGPTTERALSGLIALSVLGNLLAAQFALSRGVQELGREGVLPHSKLFASNKPFNAPLAALLVLFFIACGMLLVAPAGDAYLFMISLAGYSTFLIFAAVSLGLLLLRTPAYHSWNWDPPFQTPNLVIAVFLLSNIFLVVIPFIPPTNTQVYDYLPYWSHPVASFIVPLFGVAYWYIWCIVLPRRRGYKLERVWVLQDDGVSRYAFRKVSLT